MSGAMATATLDDFFAALFPPDAAGFIELRALPSAARAFVKADDADEIQRFLRAHANENCYFAVATRRNATGGNLQHCEKLYVLYIDIDFSKIAEADARAMIERFALKPSMIVQSGHGLHVYYLLREAIDLQHDAARAKNLLRRLALALCGDLASAEPARILRVPGTLNYKYTPPRRVLIESFQQERAYNLSDFDDLLPDEPAGDGQGKRFTLPDEIAEGDPGRNNMLYRFGRKIRHAGLTIREIIDALHTANTSRCRPSLPDRDVERIAQHVMTQPNRADFQRGVERSSSTSQPDRSLIFTPLSDLLSEPAEHRSWVLEGHLPTEGLSLLSGRPKAGKSTIARCLALCVARGEPFLGWETLKGPVLYLAFEEKRAEARAHFEAMGATSDDQVFVFVAQSPKDAMSQLRAVVERVRPVLIIVDTLLKLVRVRDSNDYAEVMRALEPLMALARETGAHVLAVHHLGKGDRSGGDAILGSTAIFAAGDTALILRRSEKYRTLSSVQRYGEDLEDTVLTLDPVTRMVTAGPLRKEADEAQATAAILDYLKGQSGPVEASEIEAAVEARTAVKRAALKALIGGGSVVRSGGGKRGDPLLYELSPILVPTYIQEQENRKPKIGVNDDEHGVNSCSRKIALSDRGSASRGGEIFAAEEVTL
jgi:hypothetical protein